MLLVSVGQMCVGVLNQVLGISFEAPDGLQAPVEKQCLPAARSV